MKVLRYVITNVELENAKYVMEALHDLIKRGIIKASDVHFREEELK